MLLKLHKCCFVERGLEPLVKQKVALLHLQVLMIW